LVVFVFGRFVLRLFLFVGAGFVSLLGWFVPLECGFFCVWGFGGKIFLVIWLFILLRAFCGGLRGFVSSYAVRIY